MQRAQYSMDILIYQMSVLKIISCQFLLISLRFTLLGIISLPKHKVTRLKGASMLHSYVDISHFHFVFVFFDLFITVSINKGVGV
jgi:hypothetical protein